MSNSDASAVGSRLLQIHSLILKTERLVKENATSGCATTSAEQLASLANEFTRTLVVSSEFYRGVATAVTGESGRLDLGPPQMASTYWLPGVDVEFMRALWFTFLQVHLPPIEQPCGFTVTFNDPSGQYALTTNVNDALFISYRNFTRFWRFHYDELFPESSTYKAYKPGDPNSVLHGWTSTLTALNRALVFPRETSESLSTYSYQRRINDWATIFPHDSHVPIAQGFAECAFDPVGALRTIAGLPVPLDYGLSQQFVQIFSGIPGVLSNFCALPENMYSDDCIVAFCDLSLLAINNFNSQYLLQLSYNFKPYATFYSFMKPMCAKAGHPQAVADCVGVDVDALLGIVADDSGSG